MHEGRKEGSVEYLHALVCRYVWHSRITCACFRKTPWPSLPWQASNTRLRYYCVVLSCPGKKGGADKIRLQICIYGEIIMFNTTLPRYSERERERAILTASPPCPAIESSFASSTAKLASAATASTATLCESDFAACSEATRVGEQAVYDTHCGNKVEVLMRNHKRSNKRANRQSI